jgi:hypothetical protein
LATYHDSTTTNNIRQNGRVTLALFDEHTAYYIKGTATELKWRMATAPENSKVNLRVEEVLTDVPDPRFEPGANITGGITFISSTRLAESARTSRMLAELLEYDHA